MTHAARSLSLTDRRTAARESRQQPLLSAFPGSELPHLSLRGVLGVGGTATVYEAFHTRLQLPVAVKVLSVPDAQAEEARARMLREARLCASLGDPRIPRIYDADVLPDGRAYVVLELLSGTPLRKILESGRPLAPELALHIASELLEPLDYLHAAGVIHRDVKPENVLLDLQSSPPRVWLIDLGIAKSVVPGANDAVLTQEGTVLGTPHYMAPERLTGEEADARSDLYAVGLLLHEMLTGTPAFTGDSPAAVMVAVLRDSPCDVRERVPGISSNLAGIVQRAVARDPAERYATARAMLKALGSDSSLALRPKVPTVLPGVSAVLPAESTEREDERSHKRNGLLLILAAIGTIVALGLSWNDDSELSGDDPPKRAAVQVTAEPSVTSVRPDHPPELDIPTYPPAAAALPAVEPEPAHAGEARTEEPVHRGHVSHHTRTSHEPRSENTTREAAQRVVDDGEEPAMSTDMFLPRGLRNNPYVAVPENPYH